MAKAAEAGKAKLAEADKEAEAEAAEIRKDAAPKLDAAVSAVVDTLLK